MKYTLTAEDNGDIISFIYENKSQNRNCVIQGELPFLTILATNKNGEVCKTYIGYQVAKELKKFLQDLF
jgi:hypothetical protein